MKKLNLLATLISLSCLCFAQVKSTHPETGKKITLYPNGTWKYVEVGNDSLLKSTGSSDEYVILKATDKMTDKTYYSFKKNLKFEKSDKAMLISVSIRNGKYSGINVYHQGIGRCNEKDKLIFLFEDGSKLTLNSWNEFGCNGVSYFDLYNKAMVDLQKKVVSIMFENGRTFDSFTADVPSYEQEYFIQVKKAIDNSIFVPAHLEDGKIIQD